MTVACLVGNGLSIAYNAELRIDRITSEFMATLTLSPDSGSLLQQSWAASLNGPLGQAPNKAVFEELLSPLERFPTVLADLELVMGLMPTLVNENGPASLAAATRFLVDVYRVAVGYTLNIIDSRAHGLDEPSRETVVRFIRAVLGMAETHGEVAFGTLHYDSLLNGAVIEVSVGGRCDLADGLEPEEALFVGRNWSLDGHPLRRVDDLMCNRVRIYDLHGSIALWRSSRVSFVRFSLDEVRGADLLGLLRGSSLDWNPAFPSRTRSPDALRSTRIPLLTPGLNGA